MSDKIKKAPEQQESPDKVGKIHGNHPEHVKGAECTARKCKKERDQLKADAERTKAEQKAHEAAGDALPENEAPLAGDGEASKDESPEVVADGKKETTGSAEAPKDEEPKGADESGSGDSNEEPDESDEDVDDRIEFVVDGAAKVDKSIRSAARKGGEKAKGTISKARSWFREAVGEVGIDVLKLVGADDAVKSVEQWMNKAESAATAAENAEGIEVDDEDSGWVKAFKLLMSPLATVGSVLAAWANPSTNSEVPAPQEEQEVEPIGDGFEITPGVKLLAPRLRMTSPFGMRVHPISKKPKKHDGVDISVPTGTKLQVTKQVKVAWIEDNPKTPGGLSVVLSDGTSYSHLSKINVKKNQVLKPGTVFAETGATGTSCTGPHLHFGKKVGGKYVDPVDSMPGGSAAKKQSDFLKNRNKKRLAKYHSKN